ncbi:hypothetical protein IWQ61_001602 [Dispira simplex]|nr:hypothetical protein IWQ61_001602 [Dispira simplex]
MVSLCRAPLALLILSLINVYTVSAFPVMKRDQVFVKSEKPVKNLPDFMSTAVVMSIKPL